MLSYKYAILQLWRGFIYHGINFFYYIIVFTSFFI